MEQQDDSRARQETSTTALTVPLHEAAVAAHSLRDILQSTVHDTLAPIKSIATSQTTKRAIISSILLSFLVLLSIGTAVVAYGLFYYIYVPEVGFSTDVWLQYGYGRPPYAAVDLSRYHFASDQAYDVSLDLVVPISAKNIELGNFMVDVNLQATDNSTIIRGSRPAILSHTPSLPFSIHSLIRLPFYLFSYNPSSTYSQPLTVTLIHQQVLQSFRTKTISSALVTVGREDMHPVPAVPSLDCRRDVPELQVYSAKLRFHAHLSGIRAFMYSHRIISFLLFSTIFFGLTISSSLLVWAVVSLRSSSSSPSSSGHGTSASSPKTVIQSLPSSPSPKTEKLSPGLGGTFEAIDRAEAEEARRRAAEGRSREGRRMYGEDDEDDDDDKESVLKGIRIGGEGETTSDTSSGNGGRAEQTKVEDESSEEDRQEGRGEAVKDDDDDAATVGGSATSVGDTASRRSFGATTVTGSTASTGTSTGRLSRTPSLRQRASRTSLNKE